MRQKQFQEVVSQQIKKCTELLAIKGNAYNFAGSDRLLAFKKAGAFQGIKPTEALVGMATKHFVSISDMSKFPVKFTESEWDEKITDAINYLLLLQGLVTEMREDNARKTNEGDDWF